MNKFDEDLETIKQFYETVIVLPELETFRRNPPERIYQIIEHSTNDEIWEHISQIIKIILASENGITGYIVAEFIPSLIWAHVRGILEKRINLRNACEKLILMIINDKRLTEIARKFNEITVREPMFNEDDKDQKRLFLITNDDMLRKDPNSSRLSDISEVYNSILVNIDTGIKGLNFICPTLKYIPISQCLNIYSFLLDIVCFHSAIITEHCFCSIFRLIHRISRVGYPPHFFPEPSNLLNSEDLQLIMNPSLVRVGLSNYLIERFSFLLLRSLFCGFANEAFLCVKDLQVVSLKQNLFIAMNGIISLNRLISKFLDEQTIKRRDFFIFNPKNIQ